MEKRGKHSKAMEGRGKVTLRELNRGKSARWICSGLTSRPFPPDLPLNHIKTANYCAQNQQSGSSKNTG